MAVLPLAGSACSPVLMESDLAPEKVTCMSFRAGRTILSDNGFGGELSFRLTVSGFLHDTSFRHKSFD